MSEEHTRGSSQPTPNQAGGRNAARGMYSVSPSSDLFYLRVLLTTLNGSDLDMTSAADPNVRRLSYTFTALRCAPDAAGAPRPA